MSRAESIYMKQRDAVLRALDEDGLDRLFRKWGLTRPREWLPNARLIMMHKLRLEIDSFSTAEKETSRNWLISRGYDTVRQPAPLCANCGKTSIGNPDCFVCAVAT